MNFLPVFEILERVGLKHLPDLAKTETWEEANFRRLHEQIYAALMPSALSSTKPDEGVLDPFRFVASASMRGDAGCAEPLCRYKKLDFLTRYAALYATSVVVPLDLPSPEHLDALSYVKPRILRALFTLLSSKILINSGRFLPTIMRTTHHCEHEVSFVKEVREAISEYMDLVAADLASKFTVRYQRPDKSPSGLPSIYIDGPEEFLEHGEIVYRELDGKAPKLSARRKYDSEGMTAIRGKQKIPFLWPIFEQIGQNSSFYLAYRMHTNVRLLTDMAGEAIFLRDLGDDAEFASNASGLRALTHALPLLGDMSIETLLKIRDEEREAFEAYRMNIHTMSKTVMSEGMSTREGNEYFASQIAPSLEKLKREIALERKRQKTRVAVGMASLAAGVAIGAFGGLPVMASVPAAALGTAIGGKLLVKAVESKCEHADDLRQNNDLFFLLRLVEEDQL
jgi:hypothetical protein